jgi:hypothetical protein
MSSHNSPPPVSSKTELEIIVNWRMIGWGAALALLLVALPVVGFLCLRGPKSEPDTPTWVASATRTATAPRTDSPRVRFDPASVAALEPSPAKTAETAPMQRAIPQHGPVAKPVVVKKQEPSEPVAAELADKTPAQSLRLGFKRSRSLYEYELLRQLSEVPTFDLDPSLKTKILATKSNGRAAKDGKGAAPKPAEPTHALLEAAAKQADLQALPLIGAKDCQKKMESVQVMQAFSRYFRGLESRSAGNLSQDASASNQIGTDQRLLSELGRTDLFKHIINTDKQARALAKDIKVDGKMKSDELAVLVQMLQVKGPHVRIQLVKVLGECKETQASVLLAQRALFDLESSVREAAVAALRDRARAEFRQVLLDGFRHPWPPVAAHAAEALAELGDIDAAPQLAALLDQPDPSAPSSDSKGNWVVRELVGINHLQNCLLCHAPSHDAADLGRSPVPKPGERLPVGGYSERSIKGDAVRTDITYLRQDFSAMKWVENPDKWPHMQRFDYVVRTRQLTTKEVQDQLNDKSAANSTQYAQRSSVLFALRELTGEDAGEDSAVWRRLLRRMGLDGTAPGEGK